MIFVCRPVGYNVDVAVGWPKTMASRCKP